MIRTDVPRQAFALTASVTSSSICASGSGDEVAAGSIQAVRIALGELDGSDVDHEALKAGLNHAVRHGDEWYVAEA